MAEDPVEAGVHATGGPTRIYEHERIRVAWDPSLCIHTAICLRQLPAVFDVSTRPWIDVDGAEPEAIAATVRACPTSALRYEGPGLEPDSADEPPTVEIRPHGPLYVRGSLTITAPGGEPRQLSRVALCRCGASANKPYCDNFPPRRRLPRHQ